MASNEIQFRLVADADGVVRGGRVTRKEFQRLSKQMGVVNAQAKRMRSNFNALAVIGATTTLIYGVARATGTATSEFIALERAMAGVGKTTGLAGTKLKALQGEFQALSIQLGASTTDLAAIGQIAGQLGVAGEDVTDFTKIIYELANASDLTQENAALMLQRFLELSGLDTSYLDVLSDKIVNVGNNAAVGEAELTEMLLSVRTGGLGIKLTTDFLVTLSAVLAESNVKAESARTTFQKLNVAIRNVVFEGGEDARFLADVIGESTSEVQRLIDENPDGLLYKLYFGAGKLSREEYERLLPLLDQEGARGRKDFGVVVQKVADGRFDEIQGLAQGADGARAREALAVRLVAEGRLAETSARVAKVWQDLGETVTPTLVLAMQAAAGEFENLAEQWMLFTSWLRETFPSLAQAVDEIDRRGRTDSVLRASGATESQVAASNRITELHDERGTLADRRRQSERLRDRSLEVINDPSSTLEQRREARESYGLALKAMEAVDARLAAIDAQIVRIIEGNELDKLRVDPAKLVEAGAGALTGGTGASADKDDAVPAETAEEANARLLREAAERVEIARGHQRMIDMIQEEGNEISRQNREVAQEAERVSYEEHVATMEMIYDRVTQTRYEAIQAHNRRVAQENEQARREEERAIEEHNRRVKQIQQELSKSIVDPIRRLIRGELSLKEAFKQMFQNVLLLSIELTILKPLQDRIAKSVEGIAEAWKKAGDEASRAGSKMGLVAKQEGGGTPFGALGGQFGGKAGQTVGFIQTIGSILGFFADGGVVPRSGYYVVGEQGPEVVKMNRGDTVYPNGMMPGARVPNVIVNTYVDGVEQVAERVVEESREGIISDARVSLLNEVSTPTSDFARAVAG